MSTRSEPIARQTLAVALSAVLRAALLLSISWLTFEFAAPEDATAFFQLLFLQGIVVAFLSAAGFFRAQTLEGDGDAVAYLQAMLFLLPISAVFPLAMYGLDADYRALGPELILMWCGASAAALSAPLSGHALKRGGPWAAFLPACIAAIAVILALLIWYLADGTWHEGIPYLCIAGFQIGTCAGLAGRTRAVLAQALRGLRGGLAPKARKFLTENLSIGAVNVAHLVLVLIIRELWSDRAPVDFVAATFLFLRFSEAALQILQMSLSRSGMADRIFTARQGLWVHSGMAFASLAMILLISARIEGGALSEWAIIFSALALQLALDSLRLVWSLSFVWQVSTFSIGRYATYTLAPPLFASLCTLWPILAGTPAALILFLFAISWSGTLISLIQARALAGQPVLRAWQR